MTPSVFGRGIVLDPGSATPDGWAGSPEFTVSDALLSDAEQAKDVADSMHRLWSAREPYVVRLAVDQGALKAAESTSEEPWCLGAAFEFVKERIAFLVWANNYDGRGGELTWWWGVKAARAFGGSVGGPCDIVVDGVPAWVDGGPRQPLDTPHVTYHRESVDTGCAAAVPKSAQRTGSFPLAPDQLAAVTHLAGAARVIAPAGSGKTRVLSERLRHLLIDRQVEPSTVTALAYNTRAAAELADRVSEVPAKVRTIHALGLSILSRHQSVRTINERDVRDIVGRLVDVQWRANTDPIAPYIEALAEVRLALRSPADVELSRKDVPGFAAMYPEYRRTLKRSGWVDFDEHVYGTVELLLSDPDARRAAQASCKHLLVDEFQDVTPAYVLLIRLLSAPAWEVFAVGDDDQTIYSHVGASPSYLVDFESWFPGAAVHALEVNYRCPPEIVEAADALLKRNRVRVAKTIRSHMDDGPRGALRVVEHSTSYAGKAVLDTVREWMDGGVKPNEIAVLARVNSALLPAQVALAEDGLPFNSSLTDSVLSRTGMRAALAYMQVAASPDRVPSDAIVDVMKRNKVGRRLGVAGRNAAMRRPSWPVSDLNQLAVAKPVLAAAFREEMRRVVEAGTLGSQHVLAFAKEAGGLSGMMEKLDSKGKATASHVDDLLALEAVAHIHPSVEGFEGWVRKALSHADDSGGITLSSIHRVKGREWPYVIVVGVSEGTLPHRLSSDAEEERRVLHVGFTRASKKAVLLTEASRPSRFIGELDGSAPTAAPDVPAVREFGGGKDAHASDEQGWGEPERKLFESLRSWRADKAAEAAVPAYVVCNDAALRSVVNRKPSTLIELASCAGFGEVRVGRYGEELLAVVADA